MPSNGRTGCSPRVFLNGNSHPDVLIQRRHVIYSQSDVAQDVFYIVKGNVKLSVTSRRGREAVVAVLHAGDFFGEGAIGDERLRQSTATAMSPCSLVRTSRRTMFSLLLAQRPFARCFITYLISKNGRAQEDMLAQIFDSTEKRLARALIQLARYDNGNKPVPIIPQISQETLSRMIGATRSHVNIFMAKFRKRGYISHQGHRKWKVNRSLLKVVLAV